MRKRRARRKAVGTRAPILVEARPNARWSLDFVHDQLACGRRFRILNVVDDVTRECLAAIPDTSISGRRVARELGDLIERRGRPEMIVSDRAIGTPLIRETMARGTELTSNAILTFAAARGIEWHYIAPGKPKRDTASSSASMGACATSFSTRRCSATWPMRSGVVPDDVKTANRDEHKRGLDTQLLGLLVSRAAADQLTVEAEFEAFVRRHMHALQAASREHPVPVDERLAKAAGRYRFR